jgi:hypothetical protein
MCVGITQDGKGTLRACKHAISGWRLWLRLEVFDNYVVRIQRQRALRIQPRQLVGNEFKRPHVLCMPRDRQNRSETIECLLVQPLGVFPRSPLRRGQLPMLPELGARQQFAA